MPGAKKGKKDKEKKEEKKEPEREPELPNGKRTYVVGGWSSLTSINKALEQVQPGDSLLINPLEGGAAYEERVLLNKDCVITGSGQCGEEVTLTVPRSAVDTEIKAKDGNDAAGVAAACGVDISGLTVTGINPEGEAAKPGPRRVGVPPPMVQKKWLLTEVNGRGQPEGTDASDLSWLRAAIELDAKKTMVAFRSCLAKDTRPVIGLGLESMTPNAELRGIIIRGGLRVKTGTLQVSGCDFSGATDEEPNLLSIDPYAAPVVRRCRFSGAKKACVYCYPHSAGSVEECDITGNGGSSCGIFFDNGATTFKGNSIKGHSTGIYSMAKALLDKAHLYGIQAPLIQGNEITEIHGTGVHLDQGANANFKKNTVSHCGYWGMTVSGGARGTFTKNTVDSKVRIHEGCRPKMVANLISARVEDYNDRGTRALDERY